MANQVFIEIVDQDCKVDQRTVETRNGQRTFSKQQAYMHKPGRAYPEPCAIPVESVQAAYPPGRYSISPGSFQVGRYGDIEINRFDFSLMPFNEGK